MEVNKVDNKNAYESKEQAWIIPRRDRPADGFLIPVQRYVKLPLYPSASRSRIGMIQSRSLPEYGTQTFMVSICKPITYWDDPVSSPVLIQLRNT
ncbi:hypothetical protein J6590_078238 [Homalodisca vitripennis]|nr:hypothetical protein J6590_078238 [Homalodisca vitripennis]